VSVMAIRGVLFDKDGTLIDFEATWQPVYKAVSLYLSDGDEDRSSAMLADAGYDAKTGKSRPGSELAVGTTDSLLDLWRPDLDREARAREITIVDEMFTAGALEHMTPIGDLAGVLSTLHERGHRLGIATNDVTRSAKACVEKLGLAHLFGFVTGYDGVARYKPAPDMALAFCEVCDLAPDEIAVVGDNAHDLEMGRAAGAGLTIGVLSGNGGHDDLAPYSDLVVGSIDDLPAALARQLQE